MLGLRLRTDSQALSKNGQPHQKTTGVARTSCTQLAQCCHSCGTRQPAGEIAAWWLRRRVFGVFGEGEVYQQTVQMLAVGTNPVQRAEVAPVFRRIKQAGSVVAGTRLPPPGE